MDVYHDLIRRFLFRLEPERAHNLSVSACQALGYVPGAKSVTRSLFGLNDPRLLMNICGLQFPLPIGLAAGWDKSGKTLGAIGGLGFGFAEIGSISARPSSGNPKPRLFRVPQHEAVVVNYGLPNDGAEVVARRFQRAKSRIPLGANIVKTNDGPHAPVGSDDEIISDYVTSVAALHKYADYITLNLSCPNAKGGKDFFQINGNIHRLLQQIDHVDIQCPVFLKLPPSTDEITHDRWIKEPDAFDFVKGFQFNLSPGKPDWLDWTLTNEAIAGMPGAVAGPPVRRRFLECIKALAKRIDRDRYVIIGGGGVSTADDAWAQITHGASLVQIYTALIYHGPVITKRICRGLLQRLDEHRFTHLSEAIGIDL